VGRFACRCGDRLNDRRFLTILTGRNLPKIRQSREAEPSTITERTVADFTQVVEQTGILAPAASGPAADPPADASLKPWPRNITRHHCPAVTGRP
jgi:hypothetical protein